MTSIGCAILILALLSFFATSCSFEPITPNFAGADAASDNNASSAKDMSEVSDLAGSGNSLTGEDQGPPTPDMPRPPQPDMQPPVDMSPPPPPDMDVVDANPPLPDMGMEPEDMGEVSIPMICDGNRTDLAIDPNNCGACGTRCDTSVGGCVAGSCVCNGSGLEYCENAGGCMDTQADPNNCGQCGNKCQTGELCVGGVCDCTGDLDRCGGECVDLSVDPRHCGMCGNSCGGDACRSGSCRDNNRCGGAPFEYVRCEEHGGVACVRNENQTGVRYCRPGPNLNFECGQRCDGDELCIKPDTFEPYQCRPYRVGRGCTECPCDDCRDGEWCRPAIMSTDKVWCIDPE